MNWVTQTTRRSPLHSAAAAGHMNVVNMLLHNGLSSTVYDLWHWRRCFDYYGLCFLPSVVGRQEGIQPVGILECDLTWALLVLEFQLSPPTLFIIACLCSNIRAGLTLLYRLTRVILETGRGNECRCMVCLFCLLSLWDCRIRRQWSSQWNYLFADLVVQGDISNSGSDPDPSCELIRDIGSRYHVVCFL